MSIAVVVLSAAVVAGCDREPRDPSRIIVAIVGEESVYLSDLAAYLSANLLDEHEASPVEDRDRVKSRLFDTFLDERLLSAEARGRGLEVSEIEVDAWLEFVSDVGDEPPNGSTDTLRRAAARRTLLLQKLRERIVSVQRNLRRGRITFDEAVIAHGSSPNQGISVEVGLASMIEEQRAALEGLRPGQVSNPVETSGGFYLFQVIEWVEKPARTDGAGWSEATEALERDRGAAAYRKELVRLREKAGIRLKIGALPFNYVPEDSAP